MLRRTASRSALLALILLGGCSSWGSAGEGAPQAPSSPLTRTAPPSGPGYIDPLLVVRDPAQRPVIEWSKDPTRANAEINHLVATYVEAVQKQDLPRATEKGLTIQAAASLRDCLASIVDIDEAWASCTVSPTTAVIVDSVTLQGPARASVRLRVLPKGVNASIPGATIQVELGRDGARLAAHRLTAK